MRWRRSSPLICLAAAANLLSACDQIYGVERNALLTTGPEPGCTAQAISMTTGVKLVWQNRETDTGQEITLTGLHQNGPVESYGFHGTTGAPVEGVVQYDFNWRGYVEFSDTDLELNAKPPQPEIDATRPIMREIETRIAKQCGLSSLPSSIAEQCIGVTCKPL